MLPICPLCEPETKLTKEEQLTLLETKYPEESTMQRIIKPLWGNYYRINYFHAPTETFPHSHFVEIQENGVIKEL